MAPLPPSRPLLYLYYPDPKLQPACIHAVRPTVVSPARSVADWPSEHQTGRGEDLQYVFGFDKGKRKGLGFTFFPKRRWDLVCSAADVPKSAYDLRHTFITEMVSEGVPLYQVAKWCGNSTRVIEERYSHLAPNHLNDVAVLVGKTGDKNPRMSARTSAKKPRG